MIHTSSGLSRLVFPLQLSGFPSRISSLSQCERGTHSIITLVCFESQGSDKQLRLFLMATQVVDDRITDESYTPSSSIYAYFNYVTMA